MVTAIPEMVMVPDAELQRLAEENGPASAEAQVLAQLKTQRAQDLQVHCFRVDDMYVTAPMPDATELASVDPDLIEALQAGQGRVKRQPSASPAGRRRNAKAGLGRETCHRAGVRSLDANSLW